MLCRGPWLGHVFFLILKGWKPPRQADPGSAPPTRCRLIATDPSSVPTASCMPGTVLALGTSRLQMWPLRSSECHRGRCDQLAMSHRECCSGTQGAAPRRIQCGVHWRSLLGGVTLRLRAEEVRLGARLGLGKACRGRPGEGGFPAVQPARGSGSRPGPQSRVSWEVLGVTDPDTMPGRLARL